MRADIDRYAWRGESPRQSIKAPAALLLEFSTVFNEPLSAYRAARRLVARAKTPAVCANWIAAVKCGDYQWGVDQGPQEGTAAGGDANARAFGPPATLR